MVRSPLSGAATAVSAVIVNQRKALVRLLVLVSFGISPTARAQLQDDPALRPIDPPLRLHGAGQLGESLDSLTPPPASAMAPAPASAALPTTRAVSLETVLVPLGFDLRGFKSLPDAELQAHYAPLVGKSVTLQQVADITQLVNETYAARGFPTCFAVVPNQDLAGQIVRVQAVEGYVRDILIEGDAGPLRERILAIAGKARDEHPLTRATFDRITALLAQLPGLKANLEIPRASTLEGATVMKVKVSLSHFAVAPGMVQSGTSTRIGAGLQEKSLTRYGEQLTLSLFPSFGSAQDRLYAVGALLPVSNNGLALKLDASEIQVTPQNVPVGSGAVLTNERVVKKISVGLAFPLMLAPDRSVLASVSVYGTRDRNTYTNPQNDRSVQIRSEVRGVQTDLNAVGTFSSDSLRAGASVVHGLPDAGASQDFVGAAPGLVPQQRLDFTKSIQNFTWVHAFDGTPVSTVLSAYAQETGHILPPSEQVFFGGNRFAAGYPIGELIGDSGYAASLELGRDSYFNLSALRFLRPYLAADSAHVHANNVTLLHDTTISGALGLRFGDTTRYTVDLSVGLPLGQLPAQGTNRPPHFNSNVQVQF